MPGNLYALNEYVIINEYFTLHLNQGIPLKKGGFLTFRSLYFLYIHTSYNFFKKNSK